MILDMLTVGGDVILSGAATGRASLAVLLDKAATEPEAPTALFLNFNSIEIATSSFLRESVLTFRDIIRRRRSNYYPVLANLNRDILDEFGELIRGANEVLIACGLSESGIVTSVSLLGKLDPKQKITLDFVKRHKETDAAELMRLYGSSEKIRHATAWNNRLASLAALGLVVEVSQGRSKRYRPLFREM